MTSTRIKAAGLALLPTVIGVAAFLLVPEGSEFRALSLVAGFPFGIVVSLVVMALAGVHGGSVAANVVAPLLVNYFGNLWLIERWIKRRAAS